MSNVAREPAAVICHCTTISWHEMLSAQAKKKKEIIKREKKKREKRRKTKKDNKKRNKRYKKEKSNKKQEKKKYTVYCTLTNHRVLGVNMIS